MISAMTVVAPLMVSHACLDAALCFLGLGMISAIGAIVFCGRILVKEFRRLFVAEEAA